MKETDIRRYAELMKELELTGLEITDDHRKVRLERSLNLTTAVTPSPAPSPAPLEAKASLPQAEDDSIVRSPIVGVFYAAPAEDAAPYVSVGDTVKKGQTLCILEAMKLMNEITAETDGVITEILVSNGDMVEYGTELFRIRS